ncbi:MAG TPA: segregation/condensation protein A [Candidatus Acidoferrales bacterium]|nr:segregation/condensation protein A [Candidatus Acidoferrales bacterium]
MSDYKVQFEVFEGPLDLLLYLIKKEEVDIYAVNLTKLATQFMDYVELMRQFDLEVAGEFLVMAATLMYIKSRELLPVDQQAVVEGEEEEGDDPRWELIRQLVEYKKFKDAAAQLQLLETRQENVYPRVPGKIEFAAEVASAKPEVGIFDLLTAVNGILKRFAEKAASAREIYEDKWTVSEKIELVRRLMAERSSVKFSELFEQAANRAEVVCTFLALLELIRLKQLTCVQREPFAEIEISQAPPATAEETSKPNTEIQAATEIQNPNETAAIAGERVQEEPGARSKPALEPTRTESAAAATLAAPDPVAQPPEAPNTNG